MQKTLSGLGLNFPRCSWWLTTLKFIGQAAPQRQTKEKVYREHYLIEGTKKHYALFISLFLSLSDTHTHTKKYLKCSVRLWHNSHQCTVNLSSRLLISIVPLTLTNPPFNPSHPLFNNRTHRQTDTHFDLRYIDTKFPSLE